MANLTVRVDLEPILDLIKENLDLSAIIEHLGQDKILDEIGAKEVSGHFGIELIDQFDYDDALDHLEAIPETVGEP